MVHPIPSYLIIIAWNQNNGVVSSRRTCKAGSIYRKGLNKSMRERQVRGGEWDKTKLSCKREKRPKKKGITLTREEKRYIIYLGGRKWPYQKGKKENIRWPIILSIMLGVHPIKIIYHYIRRSKNKVIYIALEFFFR